MQKIGELPTKLPETKNLSYEETETIETSVSSELALNGNSVINSSTKQGQRGKKDKKIKKKWIGTLSSQSLHERAPFPCCLSLKCNE